MNPNSETDRSRLKKAVEWSKQQLQPFRATRRDLIKSYAGHGYGVTETKNIDFVDLIYQAATTYQFTLAANRPRVTVNTHYGTLVPFARRFQLNVNNLIAEIKLEEVLQRAVLEAFFKLGIVKVCMADSVPVQLEPNVLADPGRPFAGNVSLDRYCHDMTAESLAQVGWAMDYYQVDFDKLKDSNLFNQKIVDQISPDHRSDSAQRDGQDTAAGLSQGGRSSDVRVYDTKELVDVWFPKERIIVTFESTLEKEPLAVREYTGPETGPYHFLTFDDVPDNTLPTAPGEHLRELADLINSLTRKLARQARGQKTTNIYEGGSEDDAQRIKRSSDQEWVKVNNVAAVGQVKGGGIDPGNQAFAMQLVDAFDRQAGNLPAMAGYGPQTDTVGQEEIIQGTVSKKAAKMQYRVVKFAGEICTDLGWLMWNDKLMAREAYDELEGFPTVRVPARWAPDIRAGDFEQYKFDIEPYSMSYQSPSQRFNAMLSVTDRILAIAQTPQAQAQGMTIDVEVLVDEAANAMNLPQLRRLVKFEGVLPEQLLPSSSDGPKQSPQTTRTNVRKNVSSGVGQQGQKAAAMDQLMSQARQQQNATTTGAAA